MTINTPPYYAQNIQTGNASAQSSVQTDIQGSGSVSTHIEVNANGEKKVLDSNSPGTYKLEVQSNNDSQKVTPTISLSPTPTASPTPILIKKDENENNSYLSGIIKKLEDFFNNFFNVFKFKQK